MAKHLPNIISPEIDIEVDGVKFKNDKKGWQDAFTAQKKGSKIELKGAAFLNGKDKMDISDKAGKNK